MNVQTMADCVCHLFNKSQLNLLFFADFGGDFIQLQKIFNLNQLFTSGLFYLYPEPLGEASRH